MLFRQPRSLEKEDEFLSNYKKRGLPVTRRHVMRCLTGVIFVTGCFLEYVAWCGQMDTCPALAGLARAAGPEGAWLSLLDQTHSPVTSVHPSHVCAHLFTAKPIARASVPLCK